MTQYIVRRIIYFIPVLIGVSLITFILMRMVPGDVAQVASGRQRNGGIPRCSFAKTTASTSRCSTGIPRLGNTAQWVGGLLKGDFGKSYFHRTAVRDELARRLPVTSS